MIGWEQNIVLSRTVKRFSFFLLNVLYTQWYTAKIQQNAML